MCVCICVLSEREKECVCVCVCVFTEYACKRRDWREREGGREGMEERESWCMYVCA